MALPQNTEKLLAAYENTYHLLEFRNYRLGLESELTVAKHYILQGYRWVGHRRKFFGVEVDLVFENQEDIIFVEVKRSNNDDFSFHRLSKGQKQRLLSVHMRTVQRTSKNVIFNYVIASHRGELSIFDDFL